jgi:hypothetical protein
MTSGMAPNSGDTSNGHACAARVGGGAAARAVAPRRCQGGGSTAWSRPLLLVLPMAVPMALIVALMAASLAACRGSGPDQELVEAKHADGFGGLIASADPVEPVDVDSAASDPDALMRAVRVPHRRVGESLGPHVFHATSSVDVTVTGGNEPEAHEKLDVTARIEYADGQRFRALVESSGDHGREIILVDGHLYLRPRHGAFHRRPATDEHEPAGWRDDIYAELAGHLELLAPGLSVRDGGAADVAGRPARRIELSRAETPRELPAAASPQRAWRSTVEVESLSGEIFLDRETGVPLRARLEGVAHARRDQRLVRMHVVVEHAIEAIGQAVAIAPPPEEQWVDTPVRSREVAERERLLEDIAQPARPAPTPENTPTGAGGDARPGRRRAAAPEETP